LEWREWIILGRIAEIDDLVRFESAAARWLGAEELG
jgi:hypothetical protein